MLLLGNRLKYLVLLVFVLSGILVKPQSFTYTIFNTENSKVPDNVIKTMHIDKNSNLWFATGDCFYGGVLACFNGKEFKIFDTINSQLPDKYITKISSDNKGNIWIGTRYKGVCKFSPQKNSWKIFNKNNTPVSDNHITSICSDSLNNVWIGTNKGLNFFDGKTWKSFNTQNSALPDNRINDIKIDENATVWVATDKGVATYKDKKWNVLQTDKLGMTENLTTHISIFKNEVAISFWGGIVYFDAKNWTIINHKNSILPEFAEYRPLLANRQIWVATDQGLFVKINDKWYVQTPNNSNIPDFFITEILFDKKNKIFWIATQSGLVKLRQTNQ